MEVQIIFLIVQCDLLPRLNTSTTQIKAFEMIALHEVKSFNNFDQGVNTLIMRSKVAKSITVGSA
jgi:hypothetical protein